MPQSCSGGQVSTLQNPVSPDCDCVSISKIQFGENDTLIITLSNGQTYTSGSLTGDSGVGIQSVTVNDDYELVVVLTDGQTYTSASLQGPAGAAGPQGPAGADGLDGNQVVRAIMAITGSSTYAGWTTVDTATLDASTFEEDQDLVSFVARAIVVGTKEDVDGQNFRILLDGQTICVAGPLGVNGPQGVRFEGNIVRSTDGAVRVEYKVIPIEDAVLAFISNAEIHYSPVVYTGLDFSAPIDLEFQVLGDDIRDDIFIVQKHKYVAP